MKKKKRRIIFRVFPFNALTFPLLLNVWEKHRIDGEFEIQVRDRPGKLRPGDIVVYSFMTPHLPVIFDEIKAVNNPDILIVGGGPHINGEQELAFRVGLDILFVGPGERSFLEFAHDLLQGRVGVKKERSIYTGPQIFSLDPYFPISKYTRTVPPLEIMRGCRWKCRYCSTHLHKLEFRSLSSIRRFLEIIKRNRYPRINFISPSSLEYRSEGGRKIDTAQIDDLLELAAGYRFPFLEYGVFPSETRPDSVTTEVMSILKRYVSNKKLTIGAQSGSNERLMTLKRGHRTGDIEEAVSIANSNGFFVNLDFMIGYPDETPEERTRTLEFIKKLNKKHRLKVQLHHFFPLSGSEYAHRLPSFLSPDEKETLTRLKKHGILTDQWRANERQVRIFLEWLERYFPDYHSRYR